MGGPGMAGNWDRWPLGAFLLPEIPGNKWDFGDILLYNLGYRSDFIPFITVKGHNCTVPFCF
jgi:hypothetical protein